MSKSSNADAGAEIGVNVCGGFGLGYGAVVGTAVCPVIGTVIGGAIGWLCGAAAGGGVGACIGAIIDAYNEEEIEEFLSEHPSLNLFLLWITGNKWGVTVGSHKSEVTVTEGTLTPAAAQKFREETGLTRGVNQVSLDREELITIMGF